MRRDESIVGVSELRFLAGSGFPVNDVLLRCTVNHPLNLFDSRRFLLGGVGGHELLYRRFHLRFACPVSSIALGCLPHRFLSV